jgi:ketosteroid isomerase-like protein
MCTCCEEPASVVLSAVSVSGAGSVAYCMCHVHATKGSDGYDCTGLVRVVSHKERRGN